MCSSCKMDPRDMKVMYQRQGMVEVDDFEDEVKPRRPKRRKKKSRARSMTRMRCPATEDGKHVYVWVGYEDDWRPNSKIFRKHFGYYRQEQRTCCGCLSGNKIRYTEKYLEVKERKWRKLTGGEFDVQRGAPVGRPRWGSKSFYGFTWESHDQGYLDAVAAWMETVEGKKAANDVLMRRIEWRRKRLGYTN